MTPRHNRTAEAASAPGVSSRSFPTLRAIGALILREMGSRYGGTPGGYLWAVLEPLGAIIVLAVAFSLVLRAPPLGTSFILFYATGIMPFSVYGDVSQTVGRALRYSKGLLLYPSVTWVDAIMARFILNTLTALMVTYLLLAGILLTAETRSVLDLIPIVQAMMLAALLGLGIGVMNCLLFGLFPIWEQVWSIFTRPLFLASGIFFLYEDMPGIAQEILWYNPLLHIIGLMRTGFYPMYAPSYVSVLYVAAVSMILLAFGLLLLSKHYRDIING